MAKLDDYPLVAVTTAKQWSAWLRRNHAACQGAWVRFYRKDSGLRGITYEQALQEALCWGWIDGRARPLDDVSWKQGFSPRRPKGAWSMKNRDRVAALTRDGRMRPAGLAAVEAAKADGRWDRAYDPPSRMEVPRDFLAALRKDRAAYAFYRTLSRSNTFAIAYRLQSAKKPETRERRKAALLAMLARGEKLY